jgi:hypothetical protein
MSSETITISKKELQGIADKLFEALKIVQELNRK